MKLSDAFKTLYIFTFSLTLYNITYSQSNSFQGNKNQSFNPNPGTTVLALTDKNSILQSSVMDANEEVRVIIVFQSQPLVKSVNNIRKGIKASQLATTMSLIDLDHSRFATDLKQIEGKAFNIKNSAFQNANTKINFEYKTAINGAAIVTKRWVLNDLRNLSYIKAVYEDRQTSICDDESNRIIGADSVWFNLGVKGEGIKIGVLDTGIDYMHPDLGGGIGSGFKVIGGYDFVNYDNNPMDDYGHGTHVAGIISAKGAALTGVAPESKLIALKVLDRYGHGYNSQAISAIEYAMDPDKNPQTNDAVDIINMSFQSAGNPDDPLSQAVDNASDAGIICVAAAGNTGSYRSIGSPGCSRKAITVGASDKYFKVADFSSKGPAGNDFVIKPDLIAPGVNVNSAKMGGGYINMDCTSMAAPHITGAAALLLQLHPNWDPDLIKNALMQSCTDLNSDIWTQGMGLIDLKKAASLNSMVSPSSVSFGVANLENTQWSKTDTITIFNFTNEEKTFYLYLEHSMPQGAEVTLSSGAIKCAPLSNSKAAITLNVNNGILPYSTNSTFSYSGNIKITTSDKYFRIPFAFAYHPYMDMELVKSPETSPAGIYYINDKRETYFFDASTEVPLGNIYSFKMFLPDGNYDIISLWDNYLSNDQYPKGADWLIKESVGLNKFKKVRIEYSEPKYKIGTIPKDENGNPLPDDYGFNEIIFLHNKKLDLHFSHASSGFRNKNLKFYSNISPVSENYACDYYLQTVDYGIYNTKPYQFYSYGAAIPLIDKDHLVNIQKGDLLKKTTYYRAPSVCQGTTVITYTNINNVWLWGAYNVRMNALQKPFVQEWYSQPLPRKFFTNCALKNYFRVFSYNGGNFDPNNNEFLFQLPNRYIDSTGSVHLSFGFYGDPLPETNINNLTFGLGPYYWYGKFNNNSNLISLSTNSSEGEIFSEMSKEFFPVFLSQMHDFRPNSDEFSLYEANGCLFKKGKLTDYISNKFDCAEIYVNTPGKYTMEILDSSYSIRNRKGISRVRATMDLSKNDKNPPTMRSLNIIANNEYTDVITDGCKGIIQFRVNDEAIKSVELFLFSAADSAWKKIPVNNNADLYEAEIPDNLPDEFISLRIAAEDNDNNILEFLAAPAFKKGENLDIPILITPKNQMAKAPVNLTLAWNKVDNALNYKLQVSEDSLFNETLINESSLNNTEFNLSKLKNGNKYYWRATGTSLAGTSKWSDTFSFTTLLQAPESLTAVLNNEMVKISWKDKSENETGFIVERSSGNNFYVIDTLAANTIEYSDSAIIIDSSFSYRVKAFNQHAVSEYSNEVSIMITSVAEKNTIPNEYTLYQNYPNPFNPATQIKYGLPVESMVRIQVFSITGELIKELINTLQTAGYYELSFNAGNLSSGIYFLLIATTSSNGSKNFRAVRKMLLLK